MTIDPLLRFSSRARAYAAARPTYPSGVVAVLREECGIAPGSLIADVGSGTGIFTELLLAAGYRVAAVEPNDAMRALAEKRCATYTTFASVPGTAEATTLHASSVDAVTAAQAFHWFDPARVRDEWERIVRPGGWAVLVWNLRRTDSTPFMRAYDALVSRFATDARLAARERADVEAIGTLFRGRPFGTRTLEYVQSMDRDGLLGRVVSSSFMPDADDPGYVAMIGAIDELFAAHAAGGRVSFEYDTPVYFGRLGEAPAGSSSMAP